MNTSLLVYPNEAAKILGVGTNKFYEFTKLPTFPKPRNPLGKRRMYIRKEIEDCLPNLEVVQ